MTSADPTRARIEREAAALRSAHPEIAACHAELDRWLEGGVERYSMRLDIHRPQQQLAICGAAKATAHDAIATAFKRARERLDARQHAARRCGAAACMPRA